MATTSTERFGFDGVTGWATVPSNRSAVSSRTYEVPESRTKHDTFAVWFNTGQNDTRFAATLTILANVDGLQRIRKVDVGNPVQSWTWSKVEFALPADAVSVRVVLNSNAPRPIVVTQPVVDIRETATHILAAGTTLIPPSFLPSIPCATLPSASGGLFPAIPFVVIAEPYNNSLLSHFPFHLVAVTELNELHFGIPVIGKVEYDNAGKLTRTASGASSISP